MIIRYLKTITKPWLWSELSYDWAWVVLKHVLTCLLPVSPWVRFPDPFPMANMLIFPICKKNCQSSLNSQHQNWQICWSLFQYGIRMMFPGTCFMHFFMLWIIFALVGINNVAQFKVLCKKGITEVLDGTKYFPQFRKFTTQTRLGTLPKMARKRPGYILLLTIKAITTM
jgi:hypothetical protein